MSTFSEILKRERENKGYSKAELARKLNIPYTTYQNYENGREPKIDVIKQISEELGINPSVFFDLENRDPLYERNFHPIDHSEIECIMLYDSGKFEYMKDTFDNHRKELYRQSWKVHDMFDNFYNAELFLRTHGTYSIKITDPLAFYANVIPKNADHVEIQEINDQYLAEFLTALNTSINQYSAQGERVSFLTSKSMELSKYMASVLDEDWKQLRGMEIVSVAVASISYTDDSQKLINMRNQGAMLGDPSIREGFVQGAVARGLEAAGSNTGGATNAFMGMNMGGQNLAGFSQTNQAQMQAQAENKADTWTCPECNTKNTGKFCSNCGQAKPSATPVMPELNMACNECGAVVNLANGVPKFCPECGKPFVAKAL